ncbi:Z1 domain-containing protein [Pseudoclavibacter helvolus]|uniref:Z1 domain-containing protein n=1 Tax=Pseudoclavibacter helvolus TaxID=255205 RepID=UPI000838B1DB|nr:Z1 domain-containing protein [Pseudoclavibacter helvolus]
MTNNVEPRVAAAVHKVMAQIRDTGPEELLYRVQGELRKTELLILENNVIDAATVEDLNAPARHMTHMALAKWDAAKESQGWASGTAPFTPNRRERIYDLLEISNNSRAMFDHAFPSASQMDAMIVDPNHWTPWYDENRQTAHDFYWRAYRGVLESKGWDVDALTTLDRSTTEIVERLADPSAATGYQTKGLVVGHVQSGKTANFTGIVAKAIDAGYRLIIVLTGTIELLRGQTQRRLDMELVGEENILDGADVADANSIREIDYIGTQDSDWYEGRFLKHGQDIHSLPEVPAIKRLTTADKDYKKLRLGRDVLDFRRTGELRDPAKAVYAPENIYSVDARIAVMKKNPTALNNLLHDLKNIRAEGKEIPALIIDDEADQASVNTVNPRSKKELSEEAKKRSAINRLIAEMLEELPRAQYVGYTATPFANVFISPDDSEDLFPKDFIVSLEPSSKYMGGKHFHDLGGVDAEKRNNPSHSNEAAFVRPLLADGDVQPDDERVEILAAIDTFVLSGAIKKWRESTDPQFTYRHHTMLVHESVRTAEHADLADKFRNVWNRAGYSSPVGLARLRELFNQDFKKVNESRSEWDSLPLPGRFEELKSYIGDALNEIAIDHDPVVVVNGTTESDYNAMDFQLRPYWRIMVGGAKLSRGFTVEGLTISYYRRRAAAADTLMQMGRWFGYRPGYGDLVRLFIARDVVDARGKSYDLYDAFTSIIEDEEEFRAQLRQFSKIKEDGRPAVRPIHVPPLVFQQLPWLKPTGSNKMYNAVLQYEGDGGVVKDFNAHDRRDDGSRNAKHFLAVSSLLSGLATPSRFHGTNGTTFAARTKIASTEEVLDALRSFELFSRDQLSPSIEMIKRASAEGTLKDWAIIIPELDATYHRDVNGVELSVSERRRRKDRPGFPGSERRHRATLETITQKLHIETVAGEHAIALSTPTRGALLLTFAYDPERPDGNDSDLIKRDVWPASLQPQDVATLVSLAMPYESAPRGRVGFGVRRAEAAESPIVDR